MVSAPGAKRKKKVNFTQIHDQMNAIELENAVHQLFEKGNDDLIGTLFSENYIAHAGAKTHQGHRFIKQHIKSIRSSLPDVKSLKVEILARDEKSITWQRSFRGTHQTPLKGIPASGKKVTWYEMIVTRFESGKIAEEWVISDLAFQLMLKLK